MAQVAVQRETPVVRSPSMLVPLIKSDLAIARKVQEEGEEATKAATAPYFAAAGEKMLEAKGQMPHGQFTDWIKKNFRCGIRNAQLYMSVARATMDLEKRNAVSQMEHQSLREMLREHTPNTNFGRPAKWRAEVDDNIKRARDQAKRLEHESLTRQQEREAEKKLALQLISIGFKALASKLHPDKGGTKDAMARLGRVRDRLKQHA